MQSSLLHRIALPLLVILATTLGAYYYFRYEKQSQQNAEMRLFTKQYKSATNVHSTRDYTSAINAYNQLLKDAPDKSTEGKLRILIAGSLFFRNGDGDRTMSMKMYKDVVNDYKIPAMVRASALNNIASRVIGENESFYKLYLSEPPYDSFLPISGNSKVSEAYLKILEMSDETYPNSFAEYAIAGNYYAPSLANNSPTKLTTKETAEIMQRYVAEADTRGDESQYLPNVILRSLLYRAIALNASNRILMSMDKKDLEKAFKLVLDKGASYENGDDYLSIAVLMRARFFYSYFLMESFGAERNDDIKRILEPFVKAVDISDPSFKTTRDYFANIGTLRTGSFLKTRVLGLSKISPEFDQFIKSVGVI